MRTGVILASKSPERGLNAADAALRDVMGVVQMCTGRDFSSHRWAAVRRRLLRRMQLHGIGDIRGYLDFLREHPGEADVVFPSLPLSGRNFFRDKNAFYALGERVPEIFRRKDPGDAVRIWVPACATGEEAYSVAILFSEHARQRPEPPPVQIFATDRDEECVQAARRGIYAESIAAEVSPERLERYFIPEFGTFQVNRKIRDGVFFAHHDPFKDPPFSRIDLICAGSLLAGLDREAQARLLKKFHSILPGHGYLFLGASELPDDSCPLFSPLDPMRRLHFPVPVRDFESQPFGKPVLPRRPFERAALPSSPGHGGPEALEVMNEELQAATAELVHLEAGIRLRTAELDQAKRVLREEVADRRRAERIRRMLMQRLMSAQEEERRRISRGLHDEVGQQVTALMLGLKTVERDLAQGEGAETLPRLIDLVLEIGRSIHGLAVDLRPGALDDLGLVRALSSYADEFSRQSGIPVEFHTSGFGPQRLPAAYETALYRIVLEALKNVHRHSGAKSASLIVERQKNQAVAIIEDNGIGFDVASAGGGGKSRRLGLVGMRERAALLRGELEIESRPGKGTTVIVRLPLARPGRHLKN